MDFQTFCADPQLIGEPISKPWAVFYAAVEGLPLDAEQQETFRLCTGRDAYEPRSYTEATVIAGRRSEKTSTGVKFGLWKALSGGYEHQVRRGELLRVPIIAQDLRIARDIKHAAETMLLNSPVLSNEIADVFANEIRLRNGVALTCYPSSFRSTRGLAMPVALLDECAFWVVEGSSDVEVVKSVKPGQLQFGPARRLIKLSTPWQRSGLVYDEFNRRREKPDLLVWQASTSTMTPRIAADLLEAERAADPAYFAREYLAEFVDDIEAFIPGGDINAAVVPSRRELAPAAGIEYRGAIDAAGGGADWFTLAIVHQQGEQIVFDALRGWRRQPLDLVLTEIRGLRDAYRLRGLAGDQFSHQALAQLFHDRGVGELRKFDLTSDSKREVYADFKLKLAQGRIELLDHPESLRQLRGLESKRTSGGGVKIGAPPGMHDDFPSAMTLVAHELAAGLVDPASLVGVVRFEDREERHWKKFR